MSGPGWRRSMWPRRAAMLAVSLLLLAAAAWLVGSQALLAGWEALTPATIAAALLLGLVATSAQSLRWRTLAGQRGMELGWRRALADCYASSFGNMVLPGGLGGDAARVALYRNRGDRRWSSPLLALGAERLSATTVLFATVAWALLPRSVPLAAVAATVALACLAGSAWCMRGLGAGKGLAVWGSSVIGTASLIALYLAAMNALGGPVVPVTAVVGLASMSIPLGVGGWGVRELSAGVLAATMGVTSDHAVASATAYGLLATISCLPGMVVLARAWVFRAQGTPRLSPCTR
ncbi:MAG: lysylphosphatidylglycerol synthase domain-containing protein [Propionibacteriaceae bacterium]|nr:lysylphosphatidylglycerol synthase domain-containing protein [Propionibacteriaceae bacterium]